MARFNTKEKILAKVDTSGGLNTCHPWTAARDKYGYGIAKLYGYKTRRAHRLIWIISNGDPGDDISVLHSCDNPPCCNLRHLFLGDQIDNMNDRDAKGRGKGPAFENKEKTHCIHGHKLEGKNLYIRPNGYRDCKLCIRKRSRESQRRRRAEK